MAHKRTRPRRSVVSAVAAFAVAFAGGIVVTPAHAAISATWDDGTLNLSSVTVSLQSGTNYVDSTDGSPLEISVTLGDGDVFGEDDSYSMCIAQPDTETPQCDNDSADNESVLSLEPIPNTNRFLDPVQASGMLDRWADHGINFRAIVWRAHVNPNGTRNPSVFDATKDTWQYKEFSLVGPPSELAILDGPSGNEIGADFALSYSTCKVLAAVVLDEHGQFVPNQSVDTSFPKKVAGVKPTSCSSTDLEVNSVRDAKDADGNAIVEPASDWSLAATATVGTVIRSSGKSIAGATIEDVPVYPFALKASPGSTSWNGPVKFNVTGFPGVEKTAQLSTQVGGAKAAAQFAVTTDPADGLDENEVFQYSVSSHAYVCVRVANKYDSEDVQWPLQGVAIQYQITGKSATAAKSGTSLDTTDFQGKACVRVNTDTVGEQKFWFWVEKSAVADREFNLSDLGDSFIVNVVPQQVDIEESTFAPVLRTMCSPAGASAKAPVDDPSLQYKMILKDSEGNLIKNTRVDFSAAGDLESGMKVTPVSANSDADGEISVTFARLGASSAAETVYVRAEVANSKIPVIWNDELSDSDYSFDIVKRVATQLKVTTPHDVSVLRGGSTTVSGQLRDQFCAPYQGKVSFRASNFGGRNFTEAARDQVSTNASGVATYTWTDAELNPAATGDELELTAEGENDTKVSATVNLLYVRSLIPSALNSSVYFGRTSYTNRYDTTFQDSLPYEAEFRNEFDEKLMGLDFGWSVDGPATISSVTSGDADWECLAWTNEYAETCAEATPTGVAGTVVVKATLNGVTVTRTLQVQADTWKGARTLSLVEGATAAPSGKAVRYTYRLTDRYGNPMSGVLVEFTITSGLARNFGGSRNNYGRPWEEFMTDADGYVFFEFTNTSMESGVIQTAARVDADLSYELSARANRTYAGNAFAGAAAGIAKIDASTVYAIDDAASKASEQAAKDRAAAELLLKQAQDERNAAAQARLVAEAALADAQAKISEANAKLAEAKIMKDYAQAQFDAAKVTLDAAQQALVDAQAASKAATASSTAAANATKAAKAATATLAKAKKVLDLVVKKLG